MRLHQELVLGVGGVRALRALGIEPAAWHLNEGHSAFLLVERARELIAAGDDLDDGAPDGRAQRRVHDPHARLGRATSASTPTSSGGVAGPLLDGDGRPNTGGIPIERLLELGRGTDNDPNQFDMTAFSLRLTNGANAVSKLHAATANATWREHRREADPGDHQRRPPAVLGRRPDRAAVRALPRRRPRRPRRPTAATRFGSGSTASPTTSCGRRTSARSSSWPFFARRRLQTQFARHGEAPRVLEQLAEALDPDVLTIGFARRFATYKRAGLIFTDEERLARLLLNDERPVQIVFAGKAHPADRPGQRVIQDIFRRSRSPKFRGRVFVLEDYDMRDRPLPGPGRRRVAEQPAPPARGFRARAA